MKLVDFFIRNPSFAVAFSGGVDSSYLLCAAKKAGVFVKGYFVKSQFQPEFELEDARRLAREYSIDMDIIVLDVLSEGVISENSPARCYYCKKMILSEIVKKAKEDGFSIVCDGTNASDDPSERPGAKATEELGILSPLRLCSISKNDIRLYSKELGLFTTYKPANSCLATRIAFGETINEDILKQIEQCENNLFNMGFTDFRVRKCGNSARLQLNSADLPLFVKMYNQVSAVLLESFHDAVLDLKTMRGLYGQITNL